MADQATPTPRPDCGGRFSQARTVCLAGYFDAPSIATGMTFELRQLPIVCSRIVRLGTTVLELWSPNSLQFPFLPGTARPGYRAVSPATLISHRRYDGHDGKHDCLHAPQYFKPATAHWPFMRRALEVPSGDRAYVAFAPLTEYWRHDAARHPSPRGYLDPQFVASLGDLARYLGEQFASLRGRVTPLEWEQRPAAVNESALVRLLAVRTWDDAVDQGVTIQRALREREAWLALQEERGRQRHLSREDLRNMDMALAREEFMGVWVNGADEGVVLFLLAAGIPCFIVHSYALDEIIRKTEKSFDNLVSGTDLEVSLSDSNPYQHLARLQPGRLDALPVADDGRGRARPASAREEQLSSSLYLESLERPTLLHPSWLGYSRPGLPPYRAPPVAAPERESRRLFRSPTPPGAPSTAARGVTADSPHSHEAALPAAPHAEEDKYAARPIEYRAIAPDRVDWIVPPPIAPTWTKEWSKWELDEWAGVTAWVGRGKRKEIVTEHVWYDRERGRQLFFDDLVIPPGCLDTQHYGMPVPRFPFYFDNGSSGRASKASFWMYPRKEGLKREDGKRQNKPAATQLPLKKGSRGTGLPPSGGPPDSDDDADDDSDTPAQPGQGSGKGKGKARVEETSEEGTRGASLAAYAMDVDEEPPASNVVALNGVDPQVTSLMFRAFAADALYAVRATPLAMVHGQGRMWVRFASITEARRAFGALVQMNGEVAGTFEPDGAFEDAFTYSRDRWTAQTLGEMDVPNVEDVEEGSLAGTTAERSAATAGSSESTAGGDERLTAASHPALPPPTSAAPTSSGDDERFSAASPPAQAVAAVASLARPDQSVERFLAAPLPVHGPSTSADAPNLGSSLPARQTRFGPTLDIPTAPRSMRATENAFRRLSLGERLTSAPSFPRDHAPLPVPLAERLTTPLAARLSDPPSLKERLGPARPMPKRARAPSVTTSDAGTELPARKKVRRGKRAGRQVREQDEIRARFRAEAEAIAQHAEESDDQDLLSWLPALELAAEMEIDEEDARARWAEDEDDMDISPAVAGPSNQR
ncbi:hypothetical protein B0H15DRAFT_802174 [Mycena belliarum]|uniref:Uncharacterized protein n=1 Tax=Mycena belliarum TaxID=1033014 RepID=A0AAD6TZG8_9AGAR|nr:hypothetical protein B0H15DRAFT_802174 [Mycena belliae]